MQSCNPDAKLHKFINLAKKILLLIVERPSRHHRRILGITIYRGNRYNEWEYKVSKNSKVLLPLFYGNSGICHKEHTKKAPITHHEDINADVRRIIRVFAAGLT